MQLRSYSFREEAGYISARIFQSLYGVWWLALASLLALAVVTYHPSDPSLNVSGEYPVMNQVGNMGAIIADFSLQIIGAGAIVLFLTLLAWGWRCFTSVAPRYFWFRLSFLLMALVSFSLMMGSLSAPSFWQIPSNLGGAIGTVLHHHLGHYFPLWAMVSTGLVLFLLFFPLSLGLTRYEWSSMLRGTGNFGAFLMFIGSSLMRKRVQVNFTSYGFDVPRSWWENFRERFASDDEEDEDEEAVLEDEDEDEEAAPAKRVRLSPKIEKKKATPQARQEAFKLQQAGVYELPDVDFLAKPKKNQKNTVSEASLRQNAELLESVLRDFGVKGEITDIHPGPVVTLYELEPAAGTKSSRVIGLADDIARSMSAVSARIAVIPGRNVLGIEMPNAKRETVYLRELLEDESFSETEAKLPLALGKDIGGNPQVVDLSRMPHLLVAGTTGSGKSVSVNTMIASLLYHLRPDECKFIMIDPKMLELSVYDGIPHLLAPVVTEPGKAVVALKWVTKEMENRYRLMANFGVRNVEGYNKRIKEAAAKGEQLKRTVQTGFDPETGKAIYEDQPLDMNTLPFIVVVVDEMADLMLVAGKDIETSIQRLAQMARAAGIHIIMATQRPSVDVITGVIKANFPTRISFQVTSRIDSRTILGEQGAEQLLGQGDMLYMAGGGRISRVHAPFVSDGEIESIVNFLKAQGEPQYIEEVTLDPEEMEEFGMESDESDAERALYNKAVAIVKRDGKASTSYVQRCLKLGYNRAARIIEQMEREGIVSPPNHAGKREIIG